MKITMKTVIVPSLTLVLLAGANMAAAEITVIKELPWKESTISSGSGSTGYTQEESETAWGDILRWEGYDPDAVGFDWSSTELVFSGGYDLPEAPYPSDTYTGEAFISEFNGPFGNIQALNTLLDSTGGGAVEFYQFSDFSWFSVGKNTLDVHFASIGSSYPNLDFLSGIKPTYGIYIIDNQGALTDISGLDSLGSIQSGPADIDYSGQFFLQQAMNIESGADALSSLDSVADSFSLIFLPFTDLSMFSGLSDSGNPDLNITVRTMLNLTSFAGGLDQIASADSVAIYSNPLLVDIDGFNGLNEVRYLLIQGLPSLSTITGLSSLSTADEVEANGNALTNLDFLSSLSSVRLINVQQNPLVDISGLADLTGFELLRIDAGGYSPLSSSTAFCTYVAVDSSVIQGGASASDVCGS